MDRDKAGIKLNVLAQQRINRLASDIVAACEGNVWMPGPQIRLQANCQRGVGDFLVQLKQMRVPATDAEPD